jgi:ribosome biogenesis protein SSF1/2
MNNFSTQTQTPTKDAPTVPKHLETLVTTIFQSMFPPLNPQSSPLSTIKRVLLLNREPPSDPNNNAYTISLRHFAITSRRSGLNKPIKRINQADKGDKNERRGRGVPNLSKMADVSEFLLGADEAGGGSYTSASETETDTDGEVEVIAQRTKKLLGRKEREKAAARAAGDETGTKGSRPGVEKRAIKLTELGPRMRLRLIKVEEGLCGGKIMWHDHINKTKAEQKDLEEKWEQKRLQKEERKRVQKENVARKKAASKSRRGKGGEEKEGGEDGEESDGGMDYDVEDDEYWQDEDEGSGPDEDEEMEEG